METRCESCADLTIDVLRFTTVAHHLNLRDLKFCAETVQCDICVLFWFSISKQNNAGALEESLLQIESQTSNEIDKTIYLHSNFDDIAPRLLDRPGSSIVIRAGQEMQPGPPISAHVAVFAQSGTVRRLLQ